MLLVHGWGADHSYMAPQMEHFQRSHRVLAVDLRGQWQEPYPYWNASTSAPAERLRADLDVLAVLAEEGLCDAAKDISMAGAVGTALMLLECSRVGARLDVDAMPRPARAKRGERGAQRTRARSQPA